MEYSLRLKKYARLLFLLKMYNEINYYDYLDLAEIQKEGDCSFLFQHLKQQKLEFRESIEAKINQFNLQAYIYSTANGEDFPIPPSPLLPSQASSLQDSIAWCQKREEKNLFIYNYMLKEINNGELRELILSHKYHIEKFLARLNNLLVQDTES